MRNGNESQKVVLHVLDDKVAQVVYLDISVQVLWDDGRRVHRRCIPYFWHQIGIPDDEIIITVQVTSREHAWERPVTPGGEHNNILEVSQAWSVDCFNNTNVTRMKRRIAANEAKPFDNRGFVLIRSIADLKKDLRQTRYILRLGSFCLDMMSSQRACLVNTSYDKCTFLNLNSAFLFQKL